MVECFASCPEDATTRQIIAFHVGERSRASAKALWNELPAVDPEHAIFHTDQYEVYSGVIPVECSNPCIMQ